MGQELWYSSYNVKGDKTSREDDPIKQNPSEEADDLEKPKELTLVQRFKTMARNYWYVLLPVHVVSSTIFFGSFYYAASRSVRIFCIRCSCSCLLVLFQPYMRFSGVDIIAILESLHLSESVVGPLRDSSAGYIAIAYALYKIFTPLRYTVTLGKALISSSLSKLSESS